MARAMQFSQRVNPGGNLEALFVEDQFKATSWLTLTGGCALTHLTGRSPRMPPTPRRCRDSDSQA